MANPESKTPNIFEQMVARAMEQGLGDELQKKQETTTYEIRLPWQGKVEKKTSTEKPEEIIRSSEPEGSLSFKDIQKQLRRFAQDVNVTSSDPRVIALQTERDIRLDQAKKFNVVSEDGVVGVDAKIQQLQQDASTLEQAAHAISLLRSENFVSKYAADSVSPALQQELVDIVSERLKVAKTVMGVADLEAQFGSKDDRVIEAKRVLQIEGWGTPPVASLVARYDRERGLARVRKDIDGIRNPKNTPPSDDGDDGKDSPVVVSGLDKESLEEESRYDIFDKQYLADHLLPETFEVVEYGKRGAGDRRLVNTSRLLSDAFETGNIPPEFNTHWFKQAMFVEALKVTKGNRTEAAKLVNDNFWTFNWGQLPLLAIRQDTDGSFAAYSGNQKGISSALNESQFNVKAAALSLAEPEKRALGIWLAMDQGKTDRKNEGRNKVVVGKMSREDQAFVARYTQRIEQIVRTSPDALPQDLVVEELESISADMADYLKCGVGRTTGMLEMASILGFRAKSADWRKMYTKYPILEEDSKEMAMGHILKRAKIAGKVGYLAGELEKNGVEGLVGGLARMKGKQAPVTALRWWQTMEAVKDDMDEIHKMFAGEDSFMKTSDRRKAIGDKAEALAKGEVPKINKQTLAKIKSHGVHSGKGTFKQAGIGQWNILHTVRSLLE